MFWLLEPLDLIRRARALGLDGVVITEHYSYEASAPVEQVGRDEGFLVLRGVEIATDRGHLLAYGVEDDGWNIWGRDSYLPLEEVIERINDLGGICAPAHPHFLAGVETGVATIPLDLVLLDMDLETHRLVVLDDFREPRLTDRGLALPAIAEQGILRTDRLGLGDRNHALGRCHGNHPDHHECLMAPGVQAVMQGRLV